MGQPSQQPQGGKGQQPPAMGRALQNGQQSMGQVWRPPEQQAQYDRYQMGQMNTMEGRDDPNKSPYINQRYQVSGPGGAPIPGGPQQPGGGKGQQPPPQAGPGGQPPPGSGKGQQPPQQAGPGGMPMPGGGKGQQPPQWGGGNSMLTQFNPQTGMTHQGQQANLPYANMQGGPWGGWNNNPNQWSQPNWWGGMQSAAPPASNPMQPPGAPPGTGGLEPPPPAGPPGAAPPGAPPPGAPPPGAPAASLGSVGQNIAQSNQRSAQNMQELGAMDQNAVHQMMGTAKTDAERIAMATAFQSAGNAHADSFLNNLYGGDAGRKSMQQNYLEANRGQLPVWDYRNRKFMTPQEHYYQQMGWGTPPAQ